MRKSARTQIPPFFDNDPYTELSHFISFSSKFLLVNDVFTLIEICSICLVLKFR